MKLFRVFGLSMLSVGGLFVAWVFLVASATGEPLPGMKDREGVAETRSTTEKQSRQNASARSIQASSSIGIETNTGVQRVSLRNSRFLWVEPTPGENLVLRETFVRMIESNQPFELEEREVCVEAFRPESPDLSPVFSFSAKGLSPFDGKYGPDGFRVSASRHLYQVTFEGASEHCEGQLFFSLITGKPLFTADSPYGSVQIPNTKVKRVLALHTNASYWVPPEIAQDRNVVAVLQYGDLEVPASRVVMVASESKRCVGSIHFNLQGKPWTQARHIGLRNPPEEMEKTHALGLPLWASDGKDSPEHLTDFSVVVELCLMEDDLESFEKKRIEIPVIRDRLALEKAVCPAGISILPSRIEGNEPLIVLPEPGYRP